MWAPGGGGLLARLHFSGTAPEGALRSRRFVSSDRSTSPAHCSPKSRMSFCASPEMPTPAFLTSCIGNKDMGQGMPHSPYGECRQFTELSHCTSKLCMSMSMTMTLSSRLTALSLMFVKTVPLKTCGGIFTCGSCPLVWLPWV